MSITVDAARPTVRRRLRSLAAIELFNAPLQAGLWFGVVGLPVTVPNLVGFCLFAVLLLEGGSYWLAKLHQMRGRRRHFQGSAPSAPHASSTRWS